MKQKRRGELLERFGKGADRVFQALGRDAEQAFAPEGVGALGDLFGESTGRAAWHIVGAILPMDASIYRFEPVGRGGAGRVADEVLRWTEGAEDLALDEFDEVDEVEGVYVFGDPPTPQAHPAGLHIGWLVQVDDAMFLLSALRMSARRVEVANALFAAFSEVTDPPPVRLEIFRLLRDATGSPGDPLPEFNVAPAWRASVPDTEGQYRAVPIPRDLLNDAMCSAAWPDLHDIGVPGLLRWLGFTSIEGLGSREFFYYGRDLTLVREHWAREILARARCAADLAPVIDNLSHLRLAAADDPYLAEPLEALLEDAELLPPVGVLLKNLGVEPDATMPGAADERLLRHPLAVLLLPADLAATLPPDITIGAALRQLTGAPDPARAGAPEHPVETAWLTYRAERRLIASWRPEPGWVSTHLFIDSWTDLMHAMEHLFDPRAMAAPIDSLRLPTGKPLGRALSALERDDVISDRGAPLSELPATMRELQRTQGIGPTTAADLLFALFRHLATWRLPLAGLSDADLERAETRAAASEGLHTALDDLASLFDK